jgi:hypothetical protein
MNEKDPFYRKHPRLLYILAMGMMIGVYVATNKIIIGICGTLLTGNWDQGRQTSFTARQPPHKNSPKNKFAQLIGCAYICN